VNQQKTFVSILISGCILAALLPLYAALIAFPAYAGYGEILDSDTADLLNQGTVLLALGGQFGERSDGDSLFIFPSVKARIGTGGVGESMVEFNLGQVEEDGERKGYDVERLVLAQKFALYRPVDRRKPSAAVRFGVRLPVDDAAKGLGHDQTDFFARGILSGRTDGLEYRLNLGVGLLGKIEEARGQDDVLEYSAALLGNTGSSDRWMLELSGNALTRERPNQRFATLGYSFGSRSEKVRGLELAASFGLSDTSDDYRVSAAWLTEAKWF
jgi:hypothetical protein